MLPSAPGNCSFGVVFFENSRLGAIEQREVADGIHPVTGKPYRWLAEHPLYVRLEDLPTVTEDLVVAVLTATEAILREAGLVDWVDPKAPIKEPAPERLRPARNNGTGDADGFFHRING